MTANAQLVRIAAVVVCCLNAACAIAQRPTHEGKVVLFGNLHAHSALSDDVNNDSDQM